MIFRMDCFYVLRILLGSISNTKVKPISSQNYLVSKGLELRRTLLHRVLLHDLVWCRRGGVLRRRGRGPTLGPLAACRVPTEVWTGRKQ